MNPTGIGLGLTICNKILEHFGSKLEVESVLGQGTTFFFVFDIPIQEDQAALSDVLFTNNESPNVKQLRQIHKYCGNRDN
mmetsp:Transcript_14765/g.14365  ORF Transcript_14765/g.14365 Transcript_14765/m.14365 type:complete len:80 (+) Transcript_14765:1323-1562(+)